MIEFENVNYEELKHMDLEIAKEVVKLFGHAACLDFAECVIDGERYGTEYLMESNWEDGGKFRYKEEYGLLCKVDGEGKAIEKYDICVVNDITRRGSYFSYYEYKNEFRAEQIVKKVIPKVVIPEHTVITIGE